MPTGDLATLDAALTATAKVPAWSLADDALMAEHTALFRLEQRVAAARLDRLSEIDDRRPPLGQGAPSTVAWLRWRFRLPAPTAARAVRLARLLRHRPHTSAALATGDLTLDQAHAILDSLD